MTTGELATYLRSSIPLAAAMDLSVLEVCDARVRLAAPLPPNRNHHQTAFGGSVAALAVLAGWSWLHARLALHCPRVSLVIQRQELDYREPVDGDFEAICVAPAVEAWDRFVQTLLARGRARLGLAASVLCRGREAASFRGQYVAVAARPGDR
jgi:thioesterase domain-containing protein